MPEHVFKRDRIAVELKRRLQVNLVDVGYATRVIEGDGSVWGSWNTVRLPVVHWYEDVSAYTYKESRNLTGIYEITVPVQLEYIVPVHAATSFYDKGREAVGRLQRAIEIDPRFAENGDVVDDFGQPARGEELCIWYGLEAAQTAEVAQNTIDAVLVYNFVFTDKHLGFL